MSASRGFEEHSAPSPVSSSGDVLGRVRSTVDASDAVDCQVERDELADILDRMLVKHGPVQESAVAEILARLAN